MAGRGSRLRPHTLTVPKPLIPVAGQPIVHRLVKDIVKVLNQSIDEIAFILGDAAFFGDDVVNSLTKLAEDLGAKASIYRQDQPLGTGHAIMCAEESLSGPAVIAYADTLIRADFNLDPEADAVIWVKQVDRPEAFGVVKLNIDDHIVELVEKPKDFVSDLAVIGIYYFKDVNVLKEELQYVLDHNIVNGGEYQINDGIKRMMANGKIFKAGEVTEWMDCGNKSVTVETNTRMLGFLHEDDDEQMIASSVQLKNSKIIQPCYIGENVILNNSTVGPNVSIGNDCTFDQVFIKNSLVQSYNNIKNANLNNAMIGNHVNYDGDFKTISIGDYSVLE